MGLVYLPVKCPSSIIVVSGVEQLSIGNDRQRLLNGGRNFGCEEIIRMIVNRKPIVVVLTFSLRPDLLRTCRVVRRRFDKSQGRSYQPGNPILRAISMIFSDYRQFVSRLISAAARAPQSLPRGLHPAR